MIYKPYGVVGIISPWNYPFAIPFSEVVMALLAGNAVLLKVATDTLEVGRALAAVFSAAGLPDGLFSYVEIAGREAGPAFILGGEGGLPAAGGLRSDGQIGANAPRGVDKLFFTGSTAVGRELMALAAPRLLPLVLELGGADAAIVCKDADLDKAANGVVWAGLSNAGQSCGGIQRVLVHKDVYEVFLGKVCGLVEKLRLGDGFDADMGPMTSLRQKETVQKQIDACLAKGAKIAAQSAPTSFGGGIADGANGRYMPAVVLTGVTPDMPIMAEEVFGPAVAVVPVADDEEALHIANASPYGLTGSVWSRNRAKARRLAARVNAGAVMINDHLMSHGLAETPWGGFGDSGLGRTHGEMGFHEMLKAQVIVDDFLPGVKRNLWWQPYSEKAYKGMRAIVAILSGTLAERLKAIPSVLGIFFRYWEK
jgi:succinate-semialdehyde dehydrogenase/glutarate-semialdehyde dehydrogenase